MLSSWVMSNGFLDVTTTGHTPLPRKVRVHISQEALTEELPSSFRYQDCNPVRTPYRSGLNIKDIPHQELEPQKSTALTKTYQFLLGSLNWLAISTRPELSIILSLLAAYNKLPLLGHLEAAKYVLKYLCSTSNYRISFLIMDASSLQCVMESDLGSRLCAYANSNLAPRICPSHPLGTVF